MRAASIPVAVEALLLAALLSCPGASAAETFTSYAIVNDDATMKISGRLVRLYGIHIPQGDETCYSFVHPIRCGLRSALALDFKVGSHFVACETRTRHQDGSVTAQCWIDQEDLSLWMLSQGMAAAWPDAPPEYQVQERIAERRGIGIWGIPVVPLLPRPEHR